LSRAKLPKEGHAEAARYRRESSQRGVELVGGPAQRPPEAHEAMPSFEVLVLEPIDAGEVEVTIVGKVLELERQTGPDKLGGDDGLQLFEALARGVEDLRDRAQRGLALAVPGVECRKA